MAFYEDLLNGLTQPPQSRPMFGSLALPMGVGASTATVAPAPAPAATGQPAQASSIMPDPSGFDDLSTFFAGMGEGGGALLPALGAGAKAISAEKQRRQTVNQTYDLLVKKGVAPEEAKAMIGNPELLKMGLSQIYAPKTQTVAPGNVIIDNTGRTIFDNREAVKPTNDQTEYRMAVEQGFKGTFLDYVTAVKKAGAAQTIISTDNRAEGAEAKARGEGLGKRLNTVADDGVEAQRDLITLQRMGQLSNAVDPGTKTALLEEIRNLTGITLDPNTDNVQAFKAAASYLAPRMRVVGSGASSDRDVAIFFRALPGLLGTPGGNQLALETLGGMAQARMDAARIAQSWQRGEIDAAEADKRMAQINDPFKAFKAKSGSTALEDARQAIAKGAPRDKVIERLKSLGFDPGGL